MTGALDQQILETTKFKKKVQYITRKTLFPLTARKHTQAMAIPFSSLSDSKKRHLEHY